MEDSGSLSYGDRGAKKADSGDFSEERSTKREDSVGVTSKILELEQEVKSDLKKRKVDSGMEEVKGREKTQTLKKKKKSGAASDLSQREIEYFESLVEEEKEFVEEEEQRELVEAENGDPENETPSESDGESPETSDESYDMEKNSDDDDC